MELKYFLRVVKKRLLLFLLLPLIMAGVSAFISFFIMIPEYESSMTFYFVNKKEGYVFTEGNGFASINRQLINDYSEILKSKKNMEAIIEALGLDGDTPEKLANRIHVRFKNNTNIVELKASDIYAWRAKEIVDKAGAILTAKLVEFIGKDGIEIVNSAEIPDRAARPKPLFNITVAFFAGFLFAAGMVMFLEYIDDTIKTPEDVEKHLDLTVLGSIPFVGMK